MDKFTKTLKTKYKKLLDGGRDKDTLRDHFIWEIMDHDLPTKNELNRRVPKTWDIYNYLMEDERIADRDAIVNRSFFTDKTLRVQLSPMYKMKSLEQLLSNLEILLNESTTMLRQIRFKDEGDLADWIVRQKQNLDAYLTEWESIVSDVAKKAGGLGGGGVAGSLAASTPLSKISTEASAKQSGQLNSKESLALGRRYTYKVGSINSFK